MNMKSFDNFGYQTPQITLVVISSDGVLCSSTQSGEIEDLVKQDMGDIWY